MPRTRSHATRSQATRWGREEESHTSPEEQGEKRDTVGVVRRRETPNMGERHKDPEVVPREEYDQLKKALQDLIDLVKGVVLQLVMPTSVQHIVGGTVVQGEGIGESSQHHTASYLAGEVARKGKMVDPRTIGEGLEGPKRMASGRDVRDGAISAGRPWREDNMEGTPPLKLMQDAMKPRMVNRVPVEYAAEGLGEPTRASPYVNINAATTGAPSRREMTGQIDGVGYGYVDQTRGRGEAGGMKSPEYLEHGGVRAEGDMGIDQTPRMATDQGVMVGPRTLTIGNHNRR